MRIAIITESFPPDVNGVAHCVVRVAENLVRKGHHPLVIAPESAQDTAEADRRLPYPVERVPSVPVPGYPTFRLGLPTPKTRRAIARHGTEIVHLASPVALGAWGSRVARAMNLPMVAVYQTDLPNYARAYHLGRPTVAFAWRWLRDIHNTAGRTLAPSSVTAADLRAHGLERVQLWGRGVDAERFHPAKRDERLRAEIAPNGEMIVGYVGPARGREARRPAGRAGRTCRGSGSRSPAAARWRRTCGPPCRPRRSSACATARIWPGSTPAWTSSCTPGRSRPSGRRSRRRPRAACRSSRPRPAARSTWWPTGVTGYLVTPGDPGALTAAVAALAADPAARARFSAAARRRVLGRTWSALTDELIDHYDAVLNDAAPAARLAA